MASACSGPANSSNLGPSTVVARAWTGSWRQAYVVVYGWGPTQLFRHRQVLVVILTTVAAALISASPATWRQEGAEHRLWGVGSWGGGAVGHVTLCSAC
jgi:hypothetical protein